MRTLANIIWFIFGGFFAAIAWFLAGLLAAITIIGLPWAVAAFRIGAFTLWPFGRDIIDQPEGGLERAGSALGNLIWAVLAGWWLAVAHLVAAVALAITIIGIPFAWQHVKLAQLSFFPFGKMIVDVA